LLDFEADRKVGELWLIGSPVTDHLEDVLNTQLASTKHFLFGDAVTSLKASRLEA
jgi:hypothetical protein